MTDEDATLLYDLLMVDIADHPDVTITWPWPCPSCPPARAANWIYDEQFELFLA